MLRAAHARAVPVARMATRSELAARAVAATRPLPGLFTELVARIDGAVAGMAAVNAGFGTRQPDASTYEIHTGNAGKTFQLYLTESEPRKLCFVTPKSGEVLYYVWDAARAEWVHDGKTDRHLLIEMLARDLVYLCKGYPSF